MKSNDLFSSAINRYCFGSSATSQKAFIRKHLPSKFYLEGDQNISLRDAIFREITANLLVHREFTNAFPAKLITAKGLVRAENWNRPNGNGIINPASFSLLFAKTTFLQNSLHIAEHPVHAQPHPPLSKNVVSFAPNTP